MALEDEVVHPQFFGIAHAMRGWALSCIGRDDEDVAELERALADELRGSDIWAAMTAALLAEVWGAKIRCALREISDFCRQDANFGTPQASTRVCMGLG